MAYVIYLICCAMHGVLMSHMNISMGQLEYWLSLILIIASFVCGAEYADKRKR